MYYTSFALSNTGVPPSLICWSVSPMRSPGVLGDPPGLPSTRKKTTHSLTGRPIHLPPRAVRALFRDPTPKMRLIPRPFRWVFRFSTSLSNGIFLRKSRFFGTCLRGFFRNSFSLASLAKHFYPHRLGGEGVLKAVSSPDGRWWDRNQSHLLVHGVLHRVCVA